MGAVHPFPNVPDLCGLYEQPLIFGEISDFDCSPSDSQFGLDEAIANIGLDGSRDPAHHCDLEMESCFESSQHLVLDAPRAWQAGSRDWHPKDYHPYDFKLASSTSARGAWTPFDQEPSCSGVGSWSPHTTDSRSEAGGMPGQQHSPWEAHRNSVHYIPFGGSADLHPTGSHCCLPASASVISPHDLQHVQDDYLDAQSPRTDLQGISTGAEYYREDPDLCQQHGRLDPYGPKDEGIGSSIQSIKAEESQAASIKDEDEMEEDAEHDDDEDWSPKAEKGGHARRLPRRFTMAKIPATATKRPQRSKVPTVPGPKPAKIEKKSPKASFSSHQATRNAHLQPCDQCSLTFPSDSQLKKHVLASHTRPFICTFHQYGCDSTVGSKNEWKRHINVQHMHLETWRCDLGACASPAYEAPQQNGRRNHTASIAGPLDNTASQPHDFDRKDLFTQHLKRMHGPSSSAPRAERMNFEASIEDAQKRCYMKLRDPPTDTVCPFCPDQPPFESWDDRIEHVGKHLEKNDVDRNGESEDVTLRDWLAEAGYVQWKGQSQGWRLVDTGKKKKRTQVKMEVDEEEDAEGEDDE